MKLPALPPQPAATPWPTQDWPEGALGDLDRSAFDALAGEAFAAKMTPMLGETHALLIVQRGRVTFERFPERLRAHEPPRIGLHSEPGRLFSASRAPEMAARRFQRP